MVIFEYPYLIITLFVLLFIFFVAVGIHFAIRFVHTANDKAEKSFLKISALKRFYNKYVKESGEVKVVYISLKPDSTHRLHSDTKKSRMFNNISDIILRTFSANEENKLAKHHSGHYVVVTCEPIEDISVYANKCIDNIKRTLSDDEAANVFGVTFGVYNNYFLHTSFDTALKRSGQACTLAEDKGIVLFQWNRDNGKELERKIKIKNTINSEIDNNKFFLEYQPIIDVKTEKIIGAEVLSRLNSVEDGILTPGTFLSALDSVGLNVKFDYYIFEKNCKWISNDKECRQKYFYSTNFSRATLCEKDFADKIISIVERYGLDYSIVAIEVLEDKNVNDAERKAMVENIYRLKEKGVLIFLDDFGRGFTSFADLDSLNISVVKIDKDVVSKVNNRNGLLILKNILRTANELGFKTLCEGIETKEQYDTVCNAGSDLAQGYYFYRPMPVKQLEELLQNNN